MPTQKYLYFSSLFIVRESLEIPKSTTWLSITLRLVNLKFALTKFMWWSHMEVLKPNHTITPKQVVNDLITSHCLPLQIFFIGPPSPKSAVEKHLPKNIKYIQIERVPKIGMARCFKTCLFSRMFSSQTCFPIDLSIFTQIHLYSLSLLMNHFLSYCSFTFRKLGALYVHI